MATKRRRLTSLLLAIAMMLTLAPGRGQAVLRGVYFTAANELIMDLSSETMPFWSGDTLYVSSTLFEGTDLGVNYVRNSIMGLAVLYTPRTDLRFNLIDQTVHDKQGTPYNGRAIERGGVVFVPISLVCNYFGLTWSYIETDTVPLIRVKSATAQMDDSSFIDAAAGMMSNRYTAYEKWVRENSVVPPAPPPVHAVEGQKVHLVMESRSPEDTLSAMALLGEARATFLLTAEQMDNSDLLRALVSGGHEIALLATGKTEEAVEAEVEQGRQKLWRSACSWLQLVWYEGEADAAQLLEELGCRQITTALDRRGSSINSAARAGNLLADIGRYREDVTVFLGSDSSCLEGLEALTAGLLQAQYRVCAWRLAD